MDIYGLDVLNTSVWVYQQRLPLAFGSFFFIDGLAVSGDGSIVQINFRGTFNSTFYDAVAISKYNSTSGFGSFAYIMPSAGNTNTTLGLALSTNDAGDTLIIPRLTAPALYDIYQNQQPNASVGSWTYVSTVPAPPGSTSFTAQGQSTGDSKSLAAGCSMIVAGTTTYFNDSYSSGLVAIYRTGLSCPVLSPPPPPPVAPR